MKWGCLTVFQLYNMTLDETNNRWVKVYQETEEWAHSFWRWSRVSFEVPTASTSRRNEATEVLIWKIPAARDWDGLSSGGRPTDEEEEEGLPTPFWRSSKLILTGRESDQSGALLRVMENIFYWGTPNCLRAGEKALKDGGSTYVPPWTRMLTFDEWLLCCIG